MSTSTLWWGVPAPLLILGLVQVAKKLGFPSRYAGLLSIVIGVLGGIAFHFWGGSQLASDLVTGLATGLAAAGLWSTAKNALLLRGS